MRLELEEGSHLINVKKNFPIRLANPQRIVLPSIRLVLTPSCFLSLNSLLHRSFTYNDRRIKKTDLCGFTFDWPEHENSLFYHKNSRRNLQHHQTQRKFSSLLVRISQKKKKFNYENIFCPCRTFQAEMTFTLTIWIRMSSRVVPYSTGDKDKFSLPIEFLNCWWKIYCRDSRAMRIEFKIRNKKRNHSLIFFYWATSLLLRNDHVIQNIVERIFLLW